MSSSEGDSKSVLQGVANFALRPIGLALSLVVAASFLLVPILFLRGLVWVFEHAGKLSLQIGLFSNTLKRDCGEP